MIGLKLWGLGIAVLNVMYSFAYLGISISDLYVVDQDGKPLESCKLILIYKK